MRFRHKLIRLMGLFNVAGPVNDAIYSGFAQHSGFGPIGQVDNVELVLEYPLKCVHVFGSKRA